MADEEAILFANEAFYAAFRSGDLAAMDDVWAKQAPVACLHPGAVPIFEREIILGSWRDILADPGVGKLGFHSPKILSNAGTALVVCFETFGGNALAATNGFVKERGVWKMTLHQAGPCPDAPAPSETQTTRSGAVH